MPKIRITGIYTSTGRGAFPLHRSRVVSHGGAMGSENVGMSNHNDSESLSHRKPKVSLAPVFDQG